MGVFRRGISLTQFASIYRLELGLEMMIVSVAMEIMVVMAMILLRMTTALILVLDTDIKVTWPRPHS